MQRKREKECFDLPPKRGVHIPSDARNRKAMAMRLFAELPASQQAEINALAAVLTSRQ